jgi:branched-chain amino acid transport system permease protein
MADLSGARAAKITEPSGRRTGRRQAERWLNIGLFMALLGAAVLAQQLDEPFYINLASRAAILALAGVGLNLALGYGGMVSFGHAAFFGIGGYVAGISAQAAFNGAPAIAWPLEISGTTAMPVIWVAAMLFAGLAAAAATAALSTGTRRVASAAGSQFSSTASTPAAPT